MQAPIKTYGYGGRNTPAAPRDTTASLTLSRTSERTEIRSGNALVGYVEDGELFGIDRQGYAQSIILNADDDREAVRMLKEWWNTKR